MNIRMTSSIESGDAIAVEGILSGTHRGPMQTAAGELPPTGKRIELPFADVFEIQDGRVKAHRVYYDQLTFLHQLGVMP